MAKIRVGVFRGGPSSEYDVSLRTGAEVIQALQGDRYESVDILVDKTGVWHLHGAPVDPDRVARTIDVAFNALHGEYGEDGKIQQLFEKHGIRYTGSRIAPSALAMHKRHSRELFSRLGIATAPAITIAADDDWNERAMRSIREFGFPLMVKPTRHGSSIGTAVAHNAYELTDAVASAFRNDSEVLIEKFIRGQEASCGVLEHFRNTRHYAFPVIEIVPPAGKLFFDTACKYDGTAHEICPGRFLNDVRDHIQKTAIEMHEALGCRHYSRSDFIVAPNNAIYALELNTLPGLTSESLYPKVAESVGLRFPDLIHHLLTLALQNFAKI